MPHILRHYRQPEVSATLALLMLGALALTSAGWLIARAVCFYGGC